MIKANTWVMVWAFLMSLAWLIPNHYQPWTSFHSDAWIACVGVLALLPVFYGREKKVTWPLFARVTFLLCFIPWVHYAGGLLAFVSQAWITSAYLFGFSLAIVVGSNLEKKKPGKLPDALLSAIFFASIASVGLSLGSWAEVLSVGVGDYLSMGYSGGRHYANIGQPNMLASLLLWGVIASLWAYSKKAICFEVALISGAFFVIGIVLTKSRMAYVAGLVVMFFVIFYARRIKSYRLVFFCLLLGCIFFIVAFFLPWMDAFFFQREVGAVYVRSAIHGDIRLTAWELFGDAIFNSPWIGYGWTEVVNAQISVAQKYPSMGGMFGHTHNLVLDFFVWLGIPLAVLVLAFFAGWLLHVLQKIRTQEDLLLMLLLVVVGVHSMFEYPLQYATFLLPTGIVIGVVGVRATVGYGVEINKIYLIGVFLAFVLLLFGVVRDYFRVEESYNKWRFERVGLVYPKEGVPDVPDVAHLTQFKYWFQMIRMRPHSQMSPSELALREKTVRAYPSPGAIYELALAYALNNQPDEAVYWLNRLCKLASEAECVTLRNAWNVQRSSNSVIERLPWPND